MTFQCDPADNGYWAYPLPEHILAHADRAHQVLVCVWLLVLACALFALAVWRWGR